MTTKRKPGLKTADMAYVALFAVLTAVCAWISIPAAVPFTLQTFAVFCGTGLLGARRGALSVLLYILLGAAGLPVFSGFTGGIGILLGATGGYIVGFVFAALVCGLGIRALGTSVPAMVASMVLGLLVCYAFGTAWFMAVYARDAGPVGLAAALGWCVYPFVLPDLLKILLAALLAKRLAGFVRL